MKFLLTTLLLLISFSTATSISANASNNESNNKSNQAVANGSFNMGDAINIAGRQRMLSQRITQAYILQGIEPEVDKHRQVFSRSMREFARNLKRLSEFDAAEPVRHSLKTVEEEWHTFSSIAQQAVSKKSAAALFRQSNRLLPAAHQYVQDLESLVNHDSAELVNISGRQRMLSQRLAKNYVARYWEVAGENGTLLLYEDLAEFEQMLAYLLKSPLNTPEITRNLQKTQGYLKYASRGFDGDMHLSQARQIHVITGTTDIMLRNMNVVTGQYAELLNNVSLAAR